MFHFGFGFYRAFGGSRLGAFGAVAAVVVALLAPPIMVVQAHEGHDHGPSEVRHRAARSACICAFRDFELVGILRGDRLIIYLDRFATNEPVTTADIAVTIGDATEALNAEWAAEGTYTLKMPQLQSAGPVELVFSITGEPGEDLLAGTLTVPQNAAMVTPALSVIERLRIWFTSLVASDPRPTGAATNPSTVDSPRRLPDGHVFVPKPTQRLLDVRTEQLAPQEVQRAVSLIGRIIADPNSTSLVQSINGGRVMAPDGGLPRIGQAVKKGDLLARVEPTLPQADRTTILEKLGEVEQLIAVAEARLRRTRILVEKKVVAESQLVDAEAEMEGLRKRRQVLARNPRRAGSAARADLRRHRGGARGAGAGGAGARRAVPDRRPGKPVGRGAGLWRDSIPPPLGHATATAPGRPPLTLRFQGFSHALQQHASVVQFAIENPPPNLAIGLPVNVIARNGEPVTAMIVPKDALVRSANGEAMVWKHEEAELFEPRPVRTTPFDATRVIIAAGVSKGDRVVVRASDLVNQVR